VLISVEVVSNQGQGEATGSGFVLDQQGHIVTNNHVVEGARSIAVSFFDGRIVRAEVVGTDPDSDLAVIQVSDVPAEDLRPLPLADSNSIFVGQEVLAIGAPFGQAWTLTTGIVSAIDRSIQGLSGFSIGQAIQTDAAINPGNSGGPLLNLQGEVIGVNSQIISRSRSSSGVGFAIPANLVDRVAQDLIKHGSVEYSYLGIGGGEITLGIIEELGLPNTTRGVVVSRVEPRGPAGLAGLRDPRVAGQRLQSVDIITAIDGTPLEGMPSLIAYLANYTEPGQTVTLAVLRDGQTIQLSVTLSTRP
jgi:2-alkenal reductase